MSESIQIQSQSPHAPLPALPSREEIALLEIFAGLELRDIELVATPEDAARALATLGQLSVVGFDTESKPTFMKNEVSTGPHTVQLAAVVSAWVLLLHASV